MVDILPVQMKTHNTHKYFQSYKSKQIYLLKIHLFSSYNHTKCVWKFSTYSKYQKQIPYILSK